MAKRQLSGKSEARRKIIFEDAQLNTWKIIETIQADLTKPVTSYLNKRLKDQTQNIRTEISNAKLDQNSDNTVKQETKINQIIKAINENTKPA